MTRAPSAGWLVVIALAAAVAAFCVAIAASVLRRPGAAAPAGGPTVAPLSHELYLEGHSAEEGVADFRGPAIATSVTGEPGEAPGEDLVPRRRRAQARAGVGQRRGGAALAVAPGSPASP